MTAFRKALRKKRKASILIEGKSGMGKSYLALRLAYALAGKWDDIYAADTEQQSLDLADGVQLYDGCTVDGLNIADVDPDDAQAELFVNIRDEVVKAGGSVYIVDSTSHAWNNLLNTVNKLDSENSKMNKFNAWGQPQVMSNKNILGNSLWRSSDIHCITTVRLKDKVVMNPADNSVSKVYDAPIMQEQAVYEPDLVLRMTEAGTATTHPKALVLKSRYAPFVQGVEYEWTPELCDALRQYVDEGASPAAIDNQVKEQYINKVTAIVKGSKTKAIKLKSLYKTMGLTDEKLSDLTTEQLNELLNNLQ